MGAVALALAGFFATIILQYDQVSQAPLYTNLTMEDSAAIIRELDAAAIPYTLKNDGSVIMVAETDVARTRMTLAEQGLPAGGGVGYEIFDKTDALGTTSFVQNVNALRALEGELSRTIRTLQKVENARVHLVLPEKQLFAKDAQKPTASIVVKSRGQLETGQIRAIQHLVASAVPGLEPARISIVDETGRLLAEGNGEDTSEFIAATADDRTLAFQSQVEDRVRDIVESVVGTGRARVRVAAELDFNRITETQDLFDPNGQVVRSTQSRDENSQSTQPGDNQVTVANQVPPAGQPGAAPAAGATPGREQSAATEETVNYEISKTTRTRVQEVGGVKRISVAVLVDGRYETNAEGVQTYTPREQAELDRITALVRTAMGFDENRGDQVEVVNLQFAEGPQVATDFAEPGLLDFSKDDLMRFAELGVMLVLTLLVLLFAVRPLIRRILTPAEGEADAEQAVGAALAGVTGPNGTPITMVIGPNGQQLPAEVSPDGKIQVVLEAPPGPPSRIDEAKAQGAMQLDQIRRVGELVSDSPSEAAIIIRNWLMEAA